MVRQGIASTVRVAGLFIVLGCVGAEAAALETPLEGEVVYRERCAVCHDSGADGAPVLGDAASWEGRVQKPDIVLRAHLARGYFLMPKKGGDPDMSREEMDAALGYITAVSTP